MSLHAYGKERSMSRASCSSSVRLSSSLCSGRATRSLSGRERRQSTAALVTSLKKGKNNFGGNFTKSHSKITI